MPTYEFACTSGHKVDRFFRKIADAPAEIVCPECGAPAERRISGGAGLLFKGSGFYITDYGKGGKKPEGSSGEKKEGATGGGEPKGELKPAAPEKKTGSTE
jgi:putative FmdB family regulatory protein